jgi:hypothetical protein
MSTNNPSPAAKKMFQQYAEISDLPSSPDAAPLPVANAPLEVDDDLERYAAFFTDLDSYTEYWDLYRPELKGKYMGYVGLLFSGVLPEWFDYALNEKTTQAPALLTKLKKDLAVSEVTDALLQLDELQLTLIEKHFPGPDGKGIDFASYLAAVDAFAQDLLSPDADRLARTPEDDARHDYAGRHRMDGPAMWFYWASVTDCTSLIAGPNGGMTPHRALLIGAAAFGSAMDFTFRGQVGFRGKTRPQYKPNAETAALLRAQAREWVRDGNVARSQTMDLYRIFKS